uniref:Uncharacterized protein n=1 Tax=BSF nairo-like virus 1 TaxID=3233091 RepID=A0AAU8MM93_9VIRU
MDSKGSNDPNSVFQISLPDNMSKSSSSGIKRPRQSSQTAVNPKPVFRFNAKHVDLSKFLDKNFLMSLNDLRSKFLNLIGDEAAAALDSITADDKKDVNLVKKTFGPSLMNELIVKMIRALKAITSKMSDATKRDSISEEEQSLYRTCKNMSLAFYFIRLSDQEKFELVQYIDSVDDASEIESKFLRNLYGYIGTRRFQSNIIFISEIIEITNTHNQNLSSV